MAVAQSPPLVDGADGVEFVNGFTETVVDLEETPDGLISSQPRLNPVERFAHGLTYASELAIGISHLGRHSTERRSVLERTETVTTHFHDTEYKSRLVRGEDAEDRPVFLLLHPFTTNPHDGIGESQFVRLAREFPEYDVLAHGVEGYGISSPAKTFRDMAEARIGGIHEIFGSEREVIVVSISQGKAIDDQIIMHNASLRNPELADDDTNLSLPPLNTVMHLSYVGSGNIDMGMLETGYRVGFKTVKGVVSRIPATPARRVGGFLHDGIRTAASLVLAEKSHIVAQAKQNMANTSANVGRYLDPEVPDIRLGGTEDAVFNFPAQLRLLLSALSAPVRIQAYAGMDHAAAMRAHKTMRRLHEAANGPKPEAITSTELEQILRWHDTEDLVTFLYERNRLSVRTIDDKELSPELATPIVEAALPPLSQAA